jgi:hypothetical protein
MDKVITGKVMTKRDGSFKGFQYELDGKVLRKSHRFYPNGFHYAPGINGQSYKTWSFGGKPCNVCCKNFNQSYKAIPVIWDLGEMTESQRNALKKRSGEALI